jgi:hypothetical protein
LILGPEDLVAIGVGPEDAGKMVLGRYAEPLLTTLGALQVDALDASGFEGASIIHDLNEPLPNELEGRYTVVLDGGTLEHIFNFPIALANAMRLVALDGHLLLISPANNQLGHGFYQFSPELFFRALSDQHGFVCERILLKTSRSGGAWWEVIDPVAAGGRAELLTSRVTMMYVQARRVAERPVLTSPPQQSDYAAAWRGDVGIPPAVGWRGWLQQAIEVTGFARWSRRFDRINGFTGWPQRLPDRRYFRRVRL